MPFLVKSPALWPGAPVEEFNRANGQIEVIALGHFLDPGVLDSNTTEVFIDHDGEMFGVYFNTRLSGSRPAGSHSPVR